MKTTLKKIAPGKTEVTAEIDRETWKNAQEKAYKKLSKDITVPGFRPGKAPEAMLRERVSPERAFNEAVDSLLNPTLIEIISAEKVEPFKRPSVNVSKLSDEELTLVYEIVVAPTCKIGTYKGLKADRQPTEVKDEEVEEAVKRQFEGNADLVSVERPAKDGDTLVIDFKGYTKEDGVDKPFDGGEAENYSLTLGSHSFIPGFEEALVGVKPGEEKRISVTFPQEYVKELAGKDASFDVKVHEIKEKVIPEMTDEAAKDLYISGVSTLEELRKHERERLESEKKAQSDSAYLNEILKQIVEKSEFEIAEEILEDEGKARLEQLKQRIAGSGLTYEQYLELSGKKEEELLSDCRKEGEANIKTMLAMNEIARLEKIEAKEEDIEKQYQKIADQYRISADEAKKALSGREGDVASQARADLIVEYIEKANA